MWCPVNTRRSKIWILLDDSTKIVLFHKTSTFYSICRPIFDFFVFPRLNGVWTVDCTRFITKKRDKMSLQSLLMGDAHCAYGEFPNINRYYTQPNWLNRLTKTKVKWSINWIVFFRSKREKMRQCGKCLIICRLLLL